MADIITIYIYAEGTPQAGMVCEDKSLFGTNQVIMYQGCRQELDGLARFIARGCNGNAYRFRTANSIRKALRS